MSWAIWRLHRADPGGRGPSGGCRGRFGRVVNQLGVAQGSGDGWWGLEVAQGGSWGLVPRGDSSEV